jgi:hypothetical protein
MDSYLISRTEGRITELEFEIRRLRNDVARIDSRPSFVEDVLLPFMFVGACSLTGIGLVEIIARLIGIA